MVTLEGPNWSVLPVLLLEMPNPQVRSTLPPSGYLPPRDSLDLRYHRRPERATDLPNLPFGLTRISLLTSYRPLSHPNDISSNQKKPAINSNHRSKLFFSWGASNNKKKILTISSTGEDVRKLYFSRLLVEIEISTATLEEQWTCPGKLKVCIT